MPVLALPTSLHLLERLHGSSSVPVLVVTPKCATDGPKGLGQGSAWSSGCGEQQVAAVWANSVATQQLNGDSQAALDSLLSLDDGFRTFVYQHLDSLRKGEDSPCVVPNTCRLTFTFFSQPSAPPAAPIQVSASACILEPALIGGKNHAVARATSLFQCCFLPGPLPSCPASGDTSRSQLRRRITLAPLSHSPDHQGRRPQRSPSLKEMSIRQSVKLLWQRRRWPQAPLAALLLQFHPATAATVEALHYAAGSPSGGLWALSRTEEPPPPKPVLPLGIPTSGTAPLRRLREPLVSAAAAATATAAPQAPPDGLAGTITTATTITSRTATSFSVGAAAGKATTTDLLLTLQPKCGSGTADRGATPTMAAVGDMLTSAGCAADAAAATAASSPISGLNSLADRRATWWPRSCLVLSALPVSVTIFDWGGCVLFQNAASIDFYGARSAALQSADAWAAGAAAAVGTSAATVALATPVGPSCAKAPNPSSTTRNKAATIRAAASRGLLSKLMSLGFNPWHKKTAEAEADAARAAAGGSKDGERQLSSLSLSAMAAAGRGQRTGDAAGLGVAGTEWVSGLQALFAFEKTKLEELWAATAVEGGMWQGMVRVPKTLNPESFSSLASGATEEQRSENAANSGAAPQHCITGPGPSAAAGPSAGVAPDGRAATARGVESAPSAAPSAAAATAPLVAVAAATAGFEGPWRQPSPLIQGYVPEEGEEEGYVRTVSDCATASPSGLGRVMSTPVPFRSPYAMQEQPTFPSVMVADATTDSVERTSPLQPMPSTLLLPSRSSTRRVHPMAAAAAMAAMVGGGEAAAAALPQEQPQFRQSSSRGLLRSASLFRTLSVGVRRLCRFRSGTSAGLVSGGIGASVQLSCTSFCSAAGMSTVRVPFRGEHGVTRRGGASLRPLRPMGTATAVVPVAADMKTVDISQPSPPPPLWTQRSLEAGGAAAAAAAAALRSEWWPRQTCHGGASHRRWASVHTLDTSTWQVVFGNGAVTAPTACVHSAESRRGLQAPPSPAAAAEAEGVIPPGASAAAATAAAAAIPPSSGFHTCTATPSTSGCCITTDPAGSGGDAAKSSSVETAKWRRPPSAGMQDLDPCEPATVASAATVAQLSLPQGPRGRVAKPWAIPADATALAAPPALPPASGLGADARTDKLRPLPGDLPARITVGGGSGPGQSARGGGAGSSSHYARVPRSALTLGYRSCSFDAPQCSRRQSLESNLMAGLTSNASIQDCSRLMGPFDTAIAGLATASSSRIGTAAVTAGGGGGNGAGAVLPSRVVAFAASLRTAPTIPKRSTASAAAAAGDGSMAWVRSERQALRPHTAGVATGGGPQSSLSHTSFTQTRDECFSHLGSSAAAMDRGGFWPARHTVWDSPLDAADWSAEEAEGGEGRGRGSGGSRIRCAASASTVRHKLSQLGVVSEQGFALPRTAPGCRRLLVARHASTIVSRAAAVSTNPTAVATAASSAAATAAGGMIPACEEIEAYEDAAVYAAAAYFATGSGAAGREIAVAASEAGATWSESARWGSGKAKKKLADTGVNSEEQRHLCGSTSCHTYRTSGDMLSAVRCNEAPWLGSGIISAEAAAMALVEAAAGASAAASAATIIGVDGGRGKFEPECWHEVVAVGLVDPSSGRRGVVVMQRDVTAKVMAERHVAQVSETEHRLLEQIFPRHVLQYIMEESGVLSAAEDALATQPDTEVSDTARFGGPTAAAAAAAAAAARWRPHVRDCNRLAVWHPQVTVLFADIQGFTPLCKVLPPDVVMSFLNTLFTRFDAMLDECRVYKVETIGDCYMVAGGLIREDDDGMAAVQGGGQVDPDQVVNVVRFSKAMLRAASAVRLPTTGAPVKIRVGIHSGPVVSGVVGTRMPRFCLFGDTVNTASRMESTGVPGCIHASEDCFQLLKQRDPAAAEGWEPTGGIEVKVKGLMCTHLWTPPPPSPPLAVTMRTDAANFSTTMPTDATNVSTTVPSEITPTASGVGSGIVTTAAPSTPSCPESS